MFRMKLDDSFRHRMQLPYSRWMVRWMVCEEEMLSLEEGRWSRARDMSSAEHWHSLLKAVLNSGHKSEVARETA
jgi:hypothetical protein